MTIFSLAFTPSLLISVVIIMVYGLSRQDSYLAWSAALKVMMLGAVFGYGIKTVPGFVSRMCGPCGTDGERLRYVSTDDLGNGERGPPRDLEYHEAEVAVYFNAEVSDDLLFNGSVCLPSTELCLPSGE